ncbi:MAG: hypothetical protein LBP95_05595 [Deltaproteobacteria bacterium]|nr:hypothetical protein [Deltaproteobacteria bacterium]
MKIFTKSSGPGGGPRPAGGRLTASSLRGAAPYVLALVLAALFFAMGVLSGADRTEGFARFMDAAVGPGLWRAESVLWDSKTKTYSAKGLRLSDGAVFGLDGPALVGALEISGAGVREDGSAEAARVVVGGLRNHRRRPLPPRGELASDLTLSSLTLEGLRLSPGGALSADAAAVRNLAAGWRLEDSVVNLSLSSLLLSGGLILDPSGPARSDQAELRDLRLETGSPDSPAALTLRRLVVGSPDGRGLAETLELAGLQYVWPENGGGQLDTLRLGSASARNVDLGALPRPAGRLSVSELLTTWVAGGGFSWRGGLAASLAVNRPFGAAAARAEDLSILFRQNQVLAARTIDFPSLANSSLRARVEGLVLDLAPGPDARRARAAATPAGAGISSDETVLADARVSGDARVPAGRDAPTSGGTAPDAEVSPNDGDSQSPGASPDDVPADAGDAPGDGDDSDGKAPAPGGGRRENAPPGNHWAALLRRAGLTVFRGGFNLALDYDPQEQDFFLDLSGLEVEGLVSGSLRLQLSGLDTGSLASLGRLTPDNPVDPLTEPGLHHSKLNLAVLHLDDLSLTKRLLLTMVEPAPADGGRPAGPEPGDQAAGPAADSPGPPPLPAMTEEGKAALAAAGGRLADLLEMALTIRLDNILENTRELSDLARRFLADPESATLIVEPKPPLSPGEVRLARTFPELMNTLGLAVAVNQSAPVRVLFRTGPSAFDRNYTTDDYGMHPGEGPRP